VRKIYFWLRERFIMNLVRFSRLFDLCLIACSAACLAGNFGNAQVSQGTFNLPTETHWGRAVLAPGPYSFTLNRPSPDGIITVYGHGRSAFIPVSAGISTGGKSEASNLQLVTERGQTSIRSMYLGHLGLTLRYRTLRIKIPVLAQVPNSNQQVLIATAGK
jgi:hypothetical protein